MLLFQSWAWKR